MRCLFFVCLPEIVTSATEPGELCLLRRRQRRHDLLHARFGCAIEPADQLVRNRTVLFIRDVSGCEACAGDAHGYCPTDVLFGGPLNPELMLHDTTRRTFEV
jgi:hypothetical protein